MCSANGRSSGHTRIQGLLMSDTQPPKPKFASKWPSISEEALVDSGDLMAQIQAQQVDAYIARERDVLAAASDDYTAWMVYPPTPHDDPEEYAPYWTRLTDLLGESEKP